MRALLAIARKDLLLELRSGELLPTMVLFSISTFVVFHFGLDRNAIAGDLAAGVLLVTLLFAALLGIGRLFVSERENEALSGLLLAPIDRTLLFFAKAGVLFIFLSILELVAVPAFVVLLLGPGIDQLPLLLLVLLLVNLGVAAVGTLIAALATQARIRELLVPLIGLPLLLPVVVGGTKVASTLFSAGGDPIESKWLLVLVLYDMTFGLLAYAIFDLLFDD